MDEETKAYLDGILLQINNQIERLLDSQKVGSETLQAVLDEMKAVREDLKAVREDTDGTKGHVLYGLQENLTLSQRITRLEDEMRRR